MVREEQLRQENGIWIQRRLCSQEMLRTVEQKELGERRRNKIV